MKGKPKIDDANPVIFFDGVCNLCNRVVDYVIARDHGGMFRFASLQSDYAQETIPDFIDLKTIVYLHRGEVKIKSSAAIEIARSLGGWHKLMVVSYLFPRFVRDAVYDFVAKHRYQWFGQADTCRMPTAEEKSRFI